MAAIENEINEYKVYHVEDNSGLHTTLLAKDPQEAKLEHSRYIGSLHTHSASSRCNSFKISTPEYYGIKILCTQNAMEHLNKTVFNNSYNSHFQKKAHGEIMEIVQEKGVEKCIDENEREKNAYIKMFNTQPKGEKISELSLIGSLRDGFFNNRQSVIDELNSVSTDTTANKFHDTINRIIGSAKSGSHSRTFTWQLSSVEAQLEADSEGIEPPYIKGAGRG